MTKTYTIDVTVYATAYVRADDHETAATMLRHAIQSNPDLHVDPRGNDWVNGGQFDALPPVSLSPAMTIHDDDITASNMDEAWEVDNV